ncbi:hypothetical protein BCON_0143g00060 [Botryotinia convoluta]|uniref:Uncharacterized protein n=1 Tax=Botryotinia convoluta TaxID=54673 RepID=A0A4Z1HUA2_9HELO|nr:hypothetical protein BCON_0143g00060 [Botryotinia convoluta]
MASQKVPILGSDGEPLCLETVLIVIAGPGLIMLNLPSGETVKILPATGSFGGSVVMVALVMGTIVVAGGRSEDILTAPREVYGDTARLEIVVSIGEQ